MDIRGTGQTVGVVFVIVAAIFWIFDLQNYYGLPYFFSEFSLPGFLFPLGLMFLVASSMLPDEGGESKFKVQLTATLLLLVGVFMWYYKISYYYNWAPIFGRFTLSFFAISSGIVLYLLSGFIGGYGTDRTLSLLGVAFLFFAFMAWWFAWQSYFNIGLFFGRFSFVHVFVALGIIFVVGSALFGED